MYILWQRARGRHITFEMAFKNRIARARSFPLSRHSAYATPSCPRSLLVTTLGRVPQATRAKASGDLLGSRASWLFPTLMQIQARLFRLVPCAMELSALYDRCEMHLRTSGRGQDKRLTVGLAKWSAPADEKSWHVVQGHSQSRHEFSAQELYNKHEAWSACLLPRLAFIAMNLGLFAMSFWRDFNIGRQLQ